jgi:serine/threonine-protein kinase
MAEVFLAKVAGPAGFEKSMVVKRILPQLAARESFVDMFLAEARIAAQLSHQNIVQIFDFGEDNGAYFIAMELIDGLNLRSLVRWLKDHGPIAPTLAARIIMEACEGLAYAHEFTNPGTNEPMGLVHRDVSPENIMLTRTGGVKLLDFGIARVQGEDNGTRSGLLKGKIAYMPVEQLRAEELDRRADVYALGVVLYQLLSGHRPWEKSSEVALITAILNDSPTPLTDHVPGAPPALVAIVERATARDRELRFADCRAMREALERFVASTGKSVSTSDLASIAARALEAEVARQSSALDSRSSGSASGSESSGGNGSRSGISSGGRSGVSLEIDFSSDEHTQPGVEGGPAVVPKPSIEAQAALLPPARPPPEDFDTSDEPPTTLNVLPPGGLTLEAALPRATASAAVGDPAFSPARATPALPSDVRSRVGTPAPSAPRPLSATPVPPTTAPPAPSQPAPTAVAVSAPAVAAPPERGSSRLPPVGAPAGPVLSPPAPAAVAASMPVPAAPPARISSRLPPIAPPAEPVVSPSAATALPPLEPVLAPPASQPARAVVPTPLPSQPALVPQPSPAAPMRSTSGTMLPATRLVPVGFEDARSVTHTRKVVAPMAILAALRDGATSDRAQQVLRRFPAIAARLMELSPDLRGRLAESAAAMVDAALVGDEHGLIVKFLEHFDARGGAFAEALRAELAQPVRLLWLVERLRLGLPPNGSGLVTWLGKLGPPIVPLLLWAIDSLEPGPGQDTLARALGAAVQGDLTPIVSRVEAPNAKHVAALCCALEASGSVDRKSVFQRLLGRRDLSLTRQVMTGRTRAGGAEVVSLLEAALGDRDDAVRMHAASLISTLNEARLLQAMLAQLLQPAFDKRTDEERAAWWVALLGAANGAAALTAADDQLEQKTTLLTRRRSVAVKLAVIAGLKGSSVEGARALLERTAANRAQPDDVVAAAKAALQPPIVAPPLDRLSIEQRGYLRRALVLELALMTRAMTVVDAAGGLLDPAMERLRSTLRSLVLQDGKLEVTVKPDGVAVNGVTVPLRITIDDEQNEDYAPKVARLLHARDLQAFSVDGPLPVAELRGFLLHWFDPDGASSRAPHVRVATFSGRASPAVAMPVANPVPLSLEAWRAAFDFMLAQREGLRQGRLPAIGSLDPFLERWSWLYLGGGGQLLSVIPAIGRDDEFAVHAANTACVAMAFASDLELGGATIREVAELSMCWALAEQGVPAERRPAPGAPPPEDLGLRMSLLFLSQVPHRRAASYAVAAHDLSVHGNSRPGVVPTVVALAEAWDSLAVRGAQGHPGALDQLNTRFRKRFMPEVLDLFLRWGQAQLLGTR